MAGALSDALARVLGHRVDLVCAGRTDRGVHARAQVVSFDADIERADPVGLVRAVNRMCGPQISVSRASVESPDFDGPALVHRSGLPLPGAQLAGPQPAGGPACAGMSSSPWTSAPCAPRRTVCSATTTSARSVAATPRIRTSRWCAPCVGPVWWLEGEMAVFEIEAGAFCHQMVRSLVALLVSVGLGPAQAPPTWARSSRPETAAPPPLSGAPSRPGAVGCPVRPEHRGARVRIARTVTSGSALGVVVAASGPVDADELSDATALLDLSMRVTSLVPTSSHLTAGSARCDTHAPRPRRPRGAGRRSRRRRGCLCRLCRLVGAGRRSPGWPSMRPSRSRTSPRQSASLSNCCWEVSWFFSVMRLCCSKSPPQQVGGSLELSGGLLAGLLAGPLDQLAGLLFGVGDQLAGLLFGVGDQLAGLLFGVGDQLAGLLFRSWRSARGSPFRSWRSARGSPCRTCGPPFRSWRSARGSWCCRGAGSAWTRRRTRASARGSRR